MECMEAHSMKDQSVPYDQRLYENRRLDEAHRYYTLPSLVHTRWMKPMAPPDYWKTEDFGVWAVMERDRLAEMGYAQQTRETRLSLWKKAAARVGLKA